MGTSTNNMEAISIKSLCTGYDVSSQDYEVSGQ